MGTRSAVESGSSEMGLKSSIKKMETPDIPKRTARTGTRPGACFILSAGTVNFLHFVLIDPEERDFSVP